MNFDRWRYTVPLRLRALFRKSRVDAELDEEIRSHVEERAREYHARGLSEQDARRHALREFGGITQVREQCRETRGVTMVETLIQDVRYGCRLLLRNPGFAIVASLTLALGIGANTAIFSLVHVILLRPLPYARPERLVSVTGTYPKGAFVAMRGQLPSMVVAAYSDGHELNLTGLGEPVRLTATFVSAELFGLLGVQPEQGRTFRSGEDMTGNDQFVILSHSLWERQFARDREVIGRRIELNGTSREIVGVMGADFRFGSANAQLWIPLHNDPKDVTAHWAGDFMPIIGRLHAGAGLDQARSEVRTFQSRVRAMFPWPMPDAWNRDVSVVPLQRDMVAGVRDRLFMLLGAVGLVLLIACANTANLMLSRAAARQKELAIRGALGAGERRLARQLLTESALLAIVGGLFGLLLATGGLSLLKWVLPPDTPRLADVHVDWRVLAFTGALAIVTGIVFGLAPALHASRTVRHPGSPRRVLGAVGWHDRLKLSGRDSVAAVPQRLRKLLVTAEVGLAALLVVAAGLLIRSFWTLSHVNPGFRADHVLTARLTPNESFCAGPERCLAFYRAVLEQVQASPGVLDAALVNTPPLGGRVAKRSFVIEKVTAQNRVAPLFWLNIVTPDYFKVMGVPLVIGRTFVPADTSGGPPVAIVTASTARRFWGDENPVGKHVRFVGEMDWHTVVGVVGDVRAYDLQNEVPGWIAGMAYVPYTPRATGEDRRVPAAMTLVVRTTLDEAATESRIRRIVSGASREVPVSEVRTMQEAISDAVATPASTAVLFGAFAALALGLGVVGIYGVLSFLVSKRTQEIGIRLALGAQRRDVLRLMIREAVKLSASGMALGLLGAFLATRLLSSQLYGISAFDPLTYAAVVGVMTLVVVLACWVPTRRATRIDPLIALRNG
jgi:putative ABC transport system permease protein